MAKPASTAIDGLPAFYKSGDLNVIIEMPKGDEDQRGACLMMSDAKCGQREQTRESELQRAQSGFIPALLTTCAHFATSLRM